jgi:hypothetical protein
MKVILIICLAGVFYSSIRAFLSPAIAAANIQSTIPENFSGGEGSASDPYLISSVNDLVSLSNRVSGEEAERTRYAASHYSQTEDIDISSLETWNPIGESQKKPFEGVYDGGGHKIRHIRDLTIEDEDEKGSDATYLGYGLFGVVSGDYCELGVIKNIRMESSLAIYCRSLRKRRAFGAIIGFMLGGKLQNCSNCDGEITIRVRASEEIFFSKFVVGGLIGGSEDSDIENCINNARIYAYSEEGSSNISWDAGGIVGRAWSSFRSGKEAVIKDCQNRGAIEIQPVASNIGGITGLSVATLSDCRNFGDILAVAYGFINYGGISGQQRKDTLRSFNEGQIQVKNSGRGQSLKTNVGGISGYASSIKESANVGDITVEVNSLNESGAMYFDNGSAKEYYSVDVYCGGLAGVINFKT